MSLEDLASLSRRDRALLELAVEKWLHDLDRIKVAVEGLKTPTMYASEAYTLREHIGLVRRAVLAKVGNVDAAAN